jgi:hypothetical protein
MPVKMDRVVKLSAVAVAHAAYACLWGQVTGPPKGWHTAVDQVIRLRGFGTTLEK